MMKSPPGSRVIQSPVNKQMVYPGQFFQAVNQTNVRSEGQIKIPPVVINNVMVKPSIVQSSKSPSTILHQGQIHQSVIIQSPTRSVIVQALSSNNNQQVIGEKVVEKQI